MKRLLVTAAAAALLSAAPAWAEADHACLDRLCTKLSLFDAADAGSGPSRHPELVAPKFGTWGFDLAGRDMSVKPGDDFFRHANGKYLDALEIPADRSVWGASGRLNEIVQKRVLTIIEDSAAGRSASPEAARIGGLYASFMDEARLEALDAKPLAADLAEVRAADTHDKAAALMGRSAKGFGSAFFGPFVEGDFKNPKAHSLYLSHGGIGLPDRDYFLTDQFKETKAKYRDYVERSLTLIGWTDPKGAADAIVALETRIAEAHLPAAERRQFDKLYNPMTIAELEAYAPGFPWRTFLKSADLGDVQTVIVAEKAAFPKVAKIYAETPIAVLQAWQAFNVVDQASPYLSKRFVDSNFEFRGKAMSGQQQLADRWKRGTNQVNARLGEAVGKEYVAAWFPASSKAKMEALVADLRTAMKGRIERLDWMSPATKEKAQQKLSTFMVKVGYPNKWRDYSALKIDAADLYGNVERSSAFEWAWTVAKLKKPVDKDEWGMTPQTINAYYNPINNEIVFPAAILQAPLFDPDVDPAINYGGIGGVIGHEIGHGFDDQGRKFAADGSLTDWWTAEDAKKFDAAAAKLGAQYDAFEPLPGLKVNGQLTMGENIGDLLGVLLGLDAYKLSLNGKPAPVIDGLTGEQRVMYGWAQGWRRKMREPALRQLVASDPHSPAEYRVIGPLRNVDAWYDAFDVKPGDKYYLKPEDRVRLW